MSTTCIDVHLLKPLSLSQDLVEKVMILRKSIERLRNGEVAVQSAVLAEKLTHYASLLASQGSLATAMSYLPERSDQVSEHPGDSRPLRTDP